VSAARALSAGGDKTSAFASAVALAISQTGCPTLQPTLASELPLPVALSHITFIYYNIAQHPPSAAAITLVMTMPCMSYLHVITKPTSGQSAASMRSCYSSLLGCHACLACLSLAKLPLAICSQQNCMPVLTARLLCAQRQRQWRSPRGTQWRRPLLRQLPSTPSSLTASAALAPRPSPRRAPVQAAATTAVARLLRRQQLMPTPTLTTGRPARRRRRLPRRAQDLAARC
jgi:hypothetical protein